MSPPASTCRVLPTSPSFSTYEGVIPLPGGGDAWVRLEGVESRTKAGACAAASSAASGARGAPAPAPSLLRHARLVLDPELEEVMKVRVCVCACEGTGRRGERGESDADQNTS